MANSEVRDLRARPLCVTEPVPVYYFTPQVRKRHAELYRWLLSDEGKRRDQVQVLDSDGRVIQPEPWLENAPKRTEIDVPNWTLRYQAPKDETSLSSREPPFRRSLATKLETAQYLADDDDEDWIKKAGIPILVFERILTALERSHFNNLITKLTAQPLNGRFCLCLPADDEILTVKDAIRELEREERSTVERVYEYWIAKRAQNRRPLLTELWNVFPWSVLLDHSIEGKEKKSSQERRDSLEHPFEGSLKPSPAPSAKIPLDEQLHRLRIIRQDLEVARTLADQVRRREKLRKKRDELFLESLQREVGAMASPQHQTPSPERPEERSSANKGGSGSKKKARGVQSGRKSAKLRKRGGQKGNERFGTSQRLLRPRKAIQKNGRR